MSKIPIRRTTVWFAVAVVLLLGVNGFALWSNARNQSISDGILHVQDVLRAANAIDKSITNAVVATRGYIVTKEPALITELAHQRQEIRKAQATLTKVTDNYPEQATQAKTIVKDLKHLDDYLTVMNSAMESSNVEAARQLVLSGEGTQLRATLKTHLGALIDSERESMRQSQFSAKQAAIWSFQTTLAGTLLILLIASFVVVLLTRESNDLLKAQGLIQTSETRLNAIIDNTTQSISLRDLDGRYVLVNKALLDVIAKSRDQVIGQLEVDVLGEGATETAGDMAAQALASGSAVERLIVMPGDSPEDSVRAFQVVRFPVRDADGVITGIGGVSTEITEIHGARRAADEALARAEAAMASAEEANRAKSEFLSRMSHELRTPLNAIIGFAQLLQMQPDMEKHQPKLAHILKGGRHLLELINEVLDISRIESGMLSLSPESVSVFDVVCESLDMVHPLAEKGTVTIRNEIDPELHTVVQCDRQRLRQVLLNLLSNAIKYNSTEGEVLIRCATQDGRVRIEIVDSGFGISSETVSRLFQPFERLGAEGGGIEGTGLGLTLSRALIKAMGGELGYQPREGQQGSIFWIELPEGEFVGGPGDSHVHSEVFRQIGSGERTILYIEDNFPNVQLVQALFGGYDNINLRVAAQGRLGLELAADLIPDLVLLDIHLPDISGEDVLLEMRRSPALANIPIIVISADATERQIQRLLELGAFAYLTKPFDLATLLDRVSAALALSNS